MGLRGKNAHPVKRLKKKLSLTHSKNPVQDLITWIESKPITSGLLEGKKFLLGGWQKDILKAIYRTDKNGKRIVRQVLISTPRKCGKTQFAALLALSHLCGPMAERRGRIYSA